MVGLIGCGCCACCSEPTTRWSESFDQTPTVGTVWDEVTNIQSPSARSYFSASAADGFSKTSRLFIQCDSSSPMYLGINGAGRGGFYELIFGSSNNMAQWSLPAPGNTSSSSSVRLEIKNELIFLFGSQEYRSGACHIWTKTKRLTSRGVVDYYRAVMYGYFIINGGSEQRELQYDSYEITSPFQIAFGIRHQFQIFLPEMQQCERINERKWGNDGYFRVTDTFLGYWAGIRNAGYIQVNKTGQSGLEKFQCYIGMDSRVTWTGSVTGGASGSFNMFGAYVEWDRVKWEPYI